ncbi:hypothetical protein LCGC14_0109490 [marine sediment metagenome]|uniref:Membrane transport protein MMPL domain-containing protein n=1 Tax=marine sediment metagenome TaxID=412755 RepID=A0A0F9XRE9_9ZZZZ
MKQRSAGTQAYLGAWLWGLVLLGCAGLLAWQLSTGARWDTRIVNLLPDLPQTDLVMRAEKRMAEGVEDDFLMLVQGPQPRELAEDLRSRLLDQDILRPSENTSGSRPDKALTGYRYQLLADSLATTDKEVWLERALFRLFSPGLDNDLRNDPFGLQDAWIQQQLGTHLRLDGDFPVVRETGERWLLISGRLTASAYDMALQASLGEVLEGFQADHPEARILRAGLVFHAAAGAKQARQEISTIGIGSLLGLLVMLWCVFRDALTLASLMLPVACGLLVALPISWLIFGSLNLLTLAFGASLIGIAVDYALHLQSARHLAPEQPLARLWSALLLGLISSLAAYLVQLATPFPGLRQMATFAALGLTGAWLTVRLWLPMIPVRQHPATRRIANQLARLRVPAGAHLPWLALGAVALLAILVILFRLQVSDDLRQLNPSPPELIAEQQRVQQLLQRPGARHYLIVTADTDDALLTRLEQLDTALTALSDESHLDQFRHLAQAVPSAERQHQSVERIRFMHDTALPQLAERAGLPADALSSSIEPHPQPFTLTDWFATPLGAADQLLWLAASGADADAGPASLVLLGEADGVGSHALHALSQAEDVHYHDRVAQLGQVLGDIRDSIALWLGIAIAGLALVFSWRYGTSVWRVLLPPVGAILVSLAVLALNDTGLTLFHLLGLLLVLGIGLDAGIFSVEHAEQPASWLGISLSCASSLLAFGLLSFSATPALAHLGMTSLVGLGTTWLLVPFARVGRLPPTSSAISESSTSIPGKDPHGKAQPQ